MNCVLSNIGLASKYPFALLDLKGSFTFLPTLRTTDTWDTITEKVAFLTNVRLIFFFRWHKFHIFVGHYMDKVRASIRILQITVFRQFTALQGRKLANSSNATANSSLHKNRKKTETNKTIFRKNH